MDIDHIPSLSALVKATEMLYRRKLSKNQIAEIKKTSVGIAIPSQIHQKCSETYGGRNRTEKQQLDAENLEKAVDNNFDAIEACLKAEGYSQDELEQARQEIHRLNKQNGWY